MVNLKLNNQVSIFFIENQWIITDESSNFNVVIESGLSNLLIDTLSYCENHCSSDQLLEFLIEKHSLSKKTAENLISSLLENKLLRNSSDIRLDYQSDCEFVNKYLGFRYSVNHADYSDNTIYEYDNTKMQDYVASDEYPPLVKTFCDEISIDLAHPAFSEPTSIHEKIASLLFYSFGCLRDATFLEFLPVMLKCAPSKGARHPFDAYLLDAAGVIYEPGQYYYCPKRHRLYGVDSNKTPEISPDKDKSIRLYLLINFERYQWRYRHSWAYKDIFFDLGHIVEIIQSVAKNIGLDICPIAFDGVSPFDKVLKDECLFTCEVKI